MPLETPVCLCIFNRPDTTARVFEEIRRVQPTRLLVVGDGPRPDRPGEARLVQECRELIRNIDWPCKVETLYSDSNLGCGQRMASGLTWAFERAERLIILEDDCLPDPTFFDYCQQLLIRYESDPRVMMISGDNFFCDATLSSSYYFSGWGHIWGWASWRSAWSKYELANSDWPRYRQRGELASWLETDEQVEYWTGVLNAVQRGEIDTWDYSWQFTLFRERGLVVLPNQNLISNIGHDQRATHTTDPECRFSSLPTIPLDSLVHPDCVERHLAADRWTFDNLFVPAPVETTQVKKTSWFRRLLPFKKSA